MGKKIIIFFLALAPWAGEAHAPVASRTLRLQIRQGRVEGLLVYRLPARAGRVFAAAGDAAVALAPRALAGLQLDADGARLHPKVTEAKARALPDGAIEEVLLIDAGTVARSLRVAVDEWPPLAVELVAGSAVKLSLQDGPGAPSPGGLTLRPRPGAPCTVSISAATSTPR